jgi:hypothetical protein
MTEMSVLPSLNLLILRKIKGKILSFIAYRSAGRKGTRKSIVFERPYCRIKLYPKLKRFMDYVYEIKRKTGVTYPLYTVIFNL